MKYPMVWLTAVLIALIVWSRYAGGPIRLQPTEPRVLDTAEVYRVVLQSHAVERPRTWRYRIEDQYIYLRKDSTKQMPGKGDTLLITGGRPVRHWCLVAPARNPEKPPFWIHLRTQLCQHYRALGVHGTALGTLEALTLGYRDDMDLEVRRAFQSAGAMHVLAVSGLHTELLYSLLLGLLTLGTLRKPMYEERVKRCVLYGTLIGLMWGYALLTGMTPSVVRSVIMLTVAKVGLMVRRRALSFNQLATAAFFILLFRPDDLFNIGFQLSFAAVAALMWLKPRNLITVSLAAQLGTLPLTMHYFGQISNYFLLSSILALPLAKVLFALALAAQTVGWLPGMSWMGVLLQWTAEGLNRSVQWVEALPGSMTAIVVSWPMVVLLYGAIVCGVLAIRRTNRWLWGTGICLTGFLVLYMIG